jgi:hypothetical protein
MVIHQHMNCIRSGVCRTDIDIRAETKANSAAVNIEQNKLYHSSLIMMRPECQSVKHPPRQFFSIVLLMKIFHGTPRLEFNHDCWQMILIMFSLKQSMLDINILRQILTPGLIIG